LARILFLLVAEEERRMPWSSRTELKAENFAGKPLV
jgi:hypothetical protein